MNHFQHNIRHLRTKAGLNQSQVASQINEKQSTYAAWEEGRSTPGYNALIELSNFYSIPIDDILKVDISEGGQTQMNAINSAIFKTKLHQIKNELAEILQNI